MNNLNRYLNLVSKFRKFDVARSALNIKKALKSFKGIGNMPDDYLELEIKWYDSIAKGSPDYSIYNHDYFIAEVWLCWQIYSKKYLASIDNPKALPTGSIRKNMGTVRAIVDLGCGMDYTTAKLKQMFPDANVFGTNIEDTFQYKIGNFIGNKKGFRVISSTRSIPKNVDLVFASEYFEHWLDPISHLKEVIENLNPRHLFIANAFSSRALGHFNSYFIDGILISGKKTSLVFNHTLRELGYQKITTKIWNNRPTYWKKI